MMQNHASAASLHFQPCMLKAVDNFEIILKIMKLVKVYLFSVIVKLLFGSVLKHISNRIIAVNY